MTDPLRTFPLTISQGDLALAPIRAHDSRPFASLLVPISSS